MGEWAEGYDAGYATGTADGAKATNNFTKRRIAELETIVNHPIIQACIGMNQHLWEEVAPRPDGHP